jgi:hypothetical protein
MPKKTLICRYCKLPYKTHTSISIYCGIECSSHYRSLENHIKNQFFHDEKRRNEELSKLERLGIKYKLPEREVSI